MGLIEDLIASVVEDLNNIRSESLPDIGIYKYVLPCNPKPYPVSGLQHFFGAAFIAARLAEFAGTDEQEQAVAFLAGLLHDYEKMGLSLQTVSNNLENILGSSTHLYETLDKYASDRLLEAVEVASKLESGGLPRRQQLIAEFVRLGDYLTGGEENWNIINVMDLVKTILDGIGVKYHLVPVVVGKQRPLIAMVAQELEENLKSNDITPLVSTPTGMLALSKTIPDNGKISGVYDSLTQYIARLSTATRTHSAEIKTTAIRLDVVSKILNVTSALPSVGDEKERKSLISKLSNAFGSVKTLHMLRLEDIETAEMLAQTPEDKMKLSLYLILSLARTIHGKADEKSISTVAGEIGLSVSGRTKEELLVQLYSELEKTSVQLDEVLKKLVDKAKKYMSEIATGEEVVKAISRILRKTINIGLTPYSPVAEETSEEIACSRCRESVKEYTAKTLYEQLQVEQKVTKVGYADVFHPDKQGKPDKATSMDGSARKLLVCPVCFFESKVFTETTGFVDGMWASNLVYYPAVSTDLLEVVKEVAKHYPVIGVDKGKKKMQKQNKEVLVIPDYVTSRVIVKTSDNLGRLTKQNLLDALDLWYYIGGNLVLTTNALSAPPPWSGLPLEMESSDVVIEEAVAKFMEELTVTKKNLEWSRTRVLRLILYKQLKTYVESLEQAEVELGRSRFLKSGLVVSNAPALDVYSLALRKHL